MAASKPTEERFFAQLKRLAAVLDKQLPVLQEQVINPPENTAVHQLRAKKTIAELRSDVKTVKANSILERRKAQDDAKFLEQLLSLSDLLITKSQKELSEIEDYMKQYGYKPPEPEPEKEEEKTGETEEQKELPSSTDNTTFSVSETAGKDVMRTPKLEDRGISKTTMEFLRSANKKPQAQNDAFLAFQRGRQPLPSVPDEFKHDGIMVTPSLLGGRKSCDESLCGHALHAALASPVPPLFETPGIKQIQKQADMFPDPTAKLPFEKNLCDSPAVPTFQTPGLSISKQAAKIAPQQALADKKKAVVGLFQEEAGAGIRWGPQEMQAPSINQTFVKEEPQPPDLTYSLEAMSDMTGVYSIVPKMPKAPDSLAERLLQDKQNITPPTPELLSDRLKKLAVSKGDNSKAPGQKWSTKWTSNEMPKPPKLLGNYSWMNNENKPPK